MKRRKNKLIRNSIILNSLKGQTVKLYTRNHKDKKDKLNDRRKIKKELKEYT